MDSQKVDVGAVRTKWVKLVLKYVYYGTAPDTAISEVAFEWEVKRCEPPPCARERA